MNKRLIIFLTIGFAVTAITLAIIIGCFSLSNKQDSTSEETAAEQKLEEGNTSTEQTAAFSPPLKFIVIPENPRQGDPVTIGVNTNEIEAVLVAGGRQLSKAKFFTVPGEDGKPGFKAAIIGIPVTARTGSATINMTNEWGAVYEIPITILAREFRSETLHLNPTVTSIVTDPNPQRTREAEIIWGIWSTTGDQIYHAGRHSLPVTSTRRTSPFGFRRTNIYSNGTSASSIHTGIDFGIPTGTEVRASGRGRVALSRMRILTGYSVVIEHAPGVYSMYYHLDSVIARENTIVETGAIVGLSGSTGYSTGPHLHWEFRVSGEYVDPDAFVSRAILDKDLIISKIYN